MDKLTEALKPCPFCGGNAKTENIGHGLPNIGNHWTVGCENRKCLGAHNGRMWGTPDDAIAAWNSRPESGSYDTSGLRELLKIQGRDGTWNHDNYLLGMYNGMELMIATIERREPEYRTLKRLESGSGVSVPSVEELDEAYELARAKAGDYEHLDGIRGIHALLTTAQPTAHRGDVDKEDPLGWPVSIFESVLRGWWDTRDPDDFEYNLRVLDDLLRDLVRPFIKREQKTAPAQPKGEVEKPTDEQVAEWKKDFEKWANSRFMNILPGLDGHIYQSMSTEMAWLGWFSHAITLLEVK